MTDNTDNHTYLILLLATPPPPTTTLSPSTKPKEPNTMSSNVGLSTPRGSGTSGYVQRNWAFMKPRSAPYPPPSSRRDDDEAGKGFRQRQPDRKILEHDRRREVEVRVLEEREKLEDENERVEEGEQEGQVVSEEEIEARCEALRERLVRELERGEEDGDGKGGVGGGPGGKKLKSYQVHELAEAKIEESERLRKALGITEDRETGEISSRRR